MSEFRFIAVSFSIVLGLAVARTLTSLVDVFLARFDAKVRWIPVCWAVLVFVLQLQFWWAILELEEFVHPWTRGEFLAVAAIPVSVFVAAALILPSSGSKPTDLMDWFDTHGRWGLVALSIYAVDAALIDYWMYQASVASWATVFLLAQAVLPMAGALISAPRPRTIITVAYAIAVLAGSWFLSPLSYE